MSRRSTSHASAGPSRTPEQEPLLGSDDSSVDGDGAGNKKYASVDVRAVALVDNDDPEADCELLVWRFMSLLTARVVEDVPTQKRQLGGSLRCSCSFADGLPLIVLVISEYRPDEHRVAHLQPCHRNWVC